MLSLDLSLVENGPPASAAPKAVLEHTDALTAWLAERGEKPLRVKQIRRQILANRVESFDAMTDLPKQLRENLAADWSVFGTTIHQQLTATDGTFKLLMRLHDDRIIECVLLSEANRRTACISTQVGCGMGCVFCASGLDGVARNLIDGRDHRATRALRNLLAGRRTAHAHRRHGHGRAAREPRQLARRAGRHRPERRLSTSANATSRFRPSACPRRLRKLADADKAYHLAVSLHAPNDESAHEDRADQRMSASTRSWKRPTRSTDAQAGKSPTNMCCSAG